MESLEHYTPPSCAAEAAERIIASSTVDDKHVERLRAELYMRPGEDPVVIRAEIDAEIEKQLTSASTAQSNGY
jgi:hypothetical protein